MQLYEKNGRKIGHTGPFEYTTVEGKFFNLKMARPTGIEPESAKKTGEAEEPDVIDISKLKTVGE